MPSWGPTGAPPTDDLAARKPPPIAAEATAIVESYRPTFASYFEVIKGKVKLIHQSINQIATGGPAVTLEQMLKAFAKMVNLQEPKEKFEGKVVHVLAAEVARLRHCQTVTAAVKPELIKLHGKVGGATSGLFGFTKELMPEDARAEFPQHAFCTHLMQVPPDTPVIPLEVFLEQFQNNLDTDDSEDKIRAALAKHLA